MFVRSFILVDSPAANYPFALSTQTIVIIENNQSITNALKHIQLQALFVGTANQPSPSNRLPCELSTRVRGPGKCDWFHNYVGDNATLGSTSGRDIDITTWWEWAREAKHVRGEGCGCDAKLNQLTRLWYGQCMHLNWTNNNKNRPNIWFIVFWFYLNYHVKNEERRILRLWYQRVVL